MVRGKEEGNKAERRTEGEVKLSRRELELKT